jgi:Protein of unknown function (DUF2442)
MNPRVIKADYESKFKLILMFDNNEVKEFDFSSYLNYPVYQSLQDESFCSNVKVFNGTVMWDDVTDFDPDTLYLESKSLTLKS